mmetsp:Transcript_7117/g.23394  ORF Transcript_7117/g.23394 Transcript_7117/m.23394 type:complete len:519 (+) Transcript_7117:2759-4315(+)
MPVRLHPAPRLRVRSRRSRNRRGPLDCRAPLWCCQVRMIIPSARARGRGRPACRAAVGRRRAKRRARDCRWPRLLPPTLGSAGLPPPFRILKGGHRASRQPRLGPRLLGDLDLERCPERAGLAPCALWAVVLEVFDGLHVLEPALRDAVAPDVHPKLAPVAADHLAALVAPVVHADGAVVLVQVQLVALVAEAVAQLPPAAARLAGATPLARDGPNALWASPVALGHELDGGCQAVGVEGLAAVAQQQVGLVVPAAAARAEGAVRARPREGVDDGVGCQTEAEAVEALAAADAAQQLVLAVPAGAASAARARQAPQHFPCGRGAARHLVRLASSACLKGSNGDILGAARSAGAVRSGGAGLAKGAAVSRSAARARSAAGVAHRRPRRLRQQGVHTRLRRAASLAGGWDGGRQHFAVRFPRRGPPRPGGSRLGSRPRASRPATPQAVCAGLPILLFLQLHPRDGVLRLPYAGPAAVRSPAPCSRGSRHVHVRLPCKGGSVPVALHRRPTKKGRMASRRM